MLPHQHGVGRVAVGRDTALIDERHIDPVPGKRLRRQRAQQDDRTATSRDQQQGARLRLQFGAQVGGNRVGQSGGGGMRIGKAVDMKRHLCSVQFGYARRPSIWSRYGGLRASDIVRRRCCSAPDSKWRGASPVPQPGPQACRTAT
jgi:hypothetical protein